MGHISMREDQQFGNARLTPDQLKSLKHHHKMGGSLNGKEIEKVLETALSALSELDYETEQRTS